MRCRIDAAWIVPTRARLRPSIGTQHQRPTKPGGLIAFGAIQVEIRALHAARSCGARKKCLGTIRPTLAASYRITKLRVSRTSLTSDHANDVEKLGPAMWTPSAPNEYVIGSRRKPRVDACRLADTYGITSQNTMSPDKGARLFPASRYKSPAAYRSKLIGGTRAAIGRSGHTLRRILKYANFTMSAIAIVPCTSIVWVGTQQG
jgi:hypothetical protein